ncbi:putative membrane protein [Helicobacter pylori Hp P-3b]|nr:putative membrane protein [Helicobacter pylori Hp P-3b]
MSFFAFFLFFALLLNAFNWILKTLLTLLQPIFNKNRTKIK